MPPSITPNPLLDAALRYAASGWSVIPIAPRAKTPLIPWTPHQQQRATPEQITAWWTRWMHANVGIVTGAVSGLVVVDLDGPEGQAEFLGRCGGALPHTPTVKTGRGTHLYFAHPGHAVSNRAGVLPGVDLRGDGGFVCAPPGLHENGTRYEWVISPDALEAWRLAPLPSWLLDTASPLTALGGGIVPEGQRNEWLYRLVRSLRLKALSSEAITAAVRAENSARCRPPLDDGELDSLLTHALTQPDREDFPPPRRGDGEAGQDADSASGLAPEPLRVPDEAMGGVASPNPVRIELIAFDTIQPVKRVWLWKDYLAIGELSQLVGDGGVGKGYICADLAARISTGKEMPDGSPNPIGPSDVIILEAEDDPGSTLLPRLANQEADLRRVHLVRVHEGFGKFDVVTFDLGELETVIKAKQPRLLIISPLNGYLPASVNPDKDVQMRRVLHPLQMFATTCQTAIVSLLHVSKATERRAQHRALGSVAYINVPRVALGAAILSFAQGQPTRGIFGGLKNNLGPLGATLGYLIDDHGLRWDGPSSLAVKRVFEQTHESATEGPGRPPKELIKAQIFLARELGGRPEGRPGPEIRALAEKQGIAEQTLYRARESLGVYTVAKPGQVERWVLNSYSREL